MPLGSSLFRAMLRRLPLLRCAPKRPACRIRDQDRGTFPFSGPASPLSNTGKGLIAYVQSINDRVASWPQDQPHHLR